MDARSLQKGQGLIEYLLISAVVVVLVVAFSVAFRTTVSDTANVMQEQTTNAIQ